jgi:hypothetical protein
MIRTTAIVLLSVGSLLILIAGSVSQYQDMRLEILDTERTLLVIYAVHGRIIAHFHWVSAEDERNFGSWKNLARWAWANREELRRLGPPPSDSPDWYVWSGPSWFGVLFPFWAGALLLGTYPAYVMARARFRHYRHRNSNLCQTCGYDLRLLPVNRCPECGTEFQQPSGNSVPAPDAEAGSFRAQADS